MSVSTEEFLRYKDYIEENYLTNIIDIDPSESSTDHIIFGYLLMFMSGHRVGKQG